jgi:hypothetical protein
MRVRIKINDEICKVYSVVVNRELYGIDTLSCSEVEFLPDREDVSGLVQVCPVCGGRGTVSECFYMGTLGSPAGSTTCRSCLGRGYVVV